MLKIFLQGLLEKYVEDFKNESLKNISGNFNQRCWLFFSESPEQPSEELLEFPGDFFTQFLKDLLISAGIAGECLFLKHHQKTSSIIPGERAE